MTLRELHTFVQFILGISVILSKGVVKQMSTITIYCNMFSRAICLILFSSSTNIVAYREIKVVYVYCSNIESICLGMSVAYIFHDTFFLSLYYCSHIETKHIKMFFMCKFLLSLCLFEKIDYDSTTRGLFRSTSENMFDLKVCTMYM